MYANIIYPLDYTFIDYPDNESISILIYLIGCGHNCSGCHSLDLQNIKYESEKTKIISLEELELELKIYSKKINTNKITLIGGDPLYSTNLKFTKGLIENLYKDFDFCIYTGYDIGFIILNNIKNFKFIKCGVYNEKFKQQSIKNNEFIQFASSNQKLYDSNFKLLSKEGKYAFKQ